MTNHGKLSPTKSGTIEASYTHMSVHRQCVTGGEIKENYNSSGVERRDTARNVGY